MSNARDALRAAGYETQAVWQEGRDGKKGRTVRAWVPKPQFLTPNTPNTSKDSNSRAETEPDGENRNSDAAETGVTSVRCNEPLDDGEPF